MTIIVTHSKVSTIPDGDDTSVVRPSDWNDDHVLVGLGTAAELDAGVPNGVATLDSLGKVPTSELPAAILGALNYQGTWNAATNTPTLTSSVGTKGYYYVVDVAGNTDLNGITDWLVGDWAVYNGTVWQKVDNTDAGGDVVGPSSATDNAIARFNLTTGKLIQNSTVTISDVGDVVNVNSVEFDITPGTLPTAEGTLFWDTADSAKTLSLVMTGGNAIQQIGEEQYFRIKASSTITEGQVVMFTGSVGASGGLTGAPATGLTASTAQYVMGVATENIANNGWGYVTSFGTVRGINTTGGAEAWVDGEILYLDPTVAGGLTKTIPTAPNPKVVVCAVTHAASNGSLFIRPSFGGILGQYEGDVQVTTPANGQLLIRDQTAGKWVNATLTDGTGISVTEGAGTVTVTNTAPDQTVSLTAGTGISTSGTYPNFTITNTAPSSGGTVTSVTGTAPVSVATGTTTPVISMAAANTTTNGYLTSTDWNTFNGKAPAVTYTTGYVPFGQGTTTPNQSSNLFWDNTNTRLGIGTNTPATSIKVVSPVNTESVISLSPTTGTYAAYAQFANTGQSFYVGLDNSAGTSFGNAAYSANLYHSGNYPMLFWTKALERMRIHASGGVSIGNTTDPGATNLSVNGTGKFGTTVGVGAATPSASGAGITFPATQSASTDANTLDDYEEGTFTPTITPSSGTFTFTYVNQYGYYTKVGNQVTATCYVRWSAFSQTGAGYAYLSGLPFTVKNAAGNYGSAGVGFYAGLTLAVGTTQLGFSSAPNQTYAYFYCSGSAVADNVVYTIAATGEIAMTLTYYTA